MANTSGKYGLRPYGPQKPDAIEEFDVDPADTAIYIGDPVKPVADKGMAADTAGSAITAGVAVGFLDSDGLPCRYYPAGNATGYKVQVNIDPQQKYMVKSTSALAATDVNACGDITMGSGSTVTGLSGAYMTTVSAAAAGFKVLGLAPIVGNAWGANQDILVIINEHFYRGSAPNGV